MMRGDKRVVTAGIFLGVGLGGFVDGILLHQILQWHEMLSSKIPPVDLVSVKLNMLYDGLFHAFAWTMTLIGVLVLASGKEAARTAPVMRPLVASMLVGWGMFNVVEGLIDHQILGLHHVHPGSNQLAWDAAYIGLSMLVVVLANGALVRTFKEPHPSMAI
jgi:uncharacterized membrane protein